MMCLPSGSLLLGHEQYQPGYSSCSAPFTTLVGGLAAETCPQLPEILLACCPGCRWCPQRRSRPERLSSGQHAWAAAAKLAARGGATGLSPSQVAAVGFGDSAARRYSALMRWASSSWSSRITMRQAASMGVPWSTSSRARAAMRSW